MTLCKPGVMGERVSKGRETGKGGQLHAHRWRKGVSKNRIGGKECIMIWEARVRRTESVATDLPEG